MRIPRKAIRSIRGQLTLLGVTYVGALVLALAALATRSLFFEPYIREKFPPLPGELDHLVERVADGTAGVEQINERIDALAQQEAKRKTPLGSAAPLPGEVQAARERWWHAVYGAWIDTDDLDANHRLARAFLARPGGFVCERTRQTLVVGNADQRGKALQLLAMTSGADQAAARELCAFARERAARRHEPQFVAQAEAALRRLGEVGHGH